jgi:hypothetical protein
MTVVETGEFTVEAGKLAEFARAVGAEAGGAAAPTFGMVVSAPLVERLLARVAGLDRTRALHGEQGFEYFDAIVPGMVLRSEARVVSDGPVAGRRGGTMRRIEIGIEHLDAATGHLVLRESMVVIEVGAP